jgi:hypothetical protein
MALDAEYRRVMTEPLLGEGPFPPKSRLAWLAVAALAARLT